MGCRANEANKVMDSRPWLKSGHCQRLTRSLEQAAEQTGGKRTSTQQPPEAGTTRYCTGNMRNC